MASSLAASTQPDDFFEISSGAICFGSRNEVLKGSQHPIQDPSCPTFECDGGSTVFVHSCYFNLRAVNGKYLVYRLVDSKRNLVTAAFCCHESLVNEDGHYKEAKRIFDVANAPWERDHATNRNTAKTWEGCVMVVNRYDWMEGYYEEEQDGITLGEDNDDMQNRNGQRNSRWLVDYELIRQECDTTDPAQKDESTKYNRIMSAVTNKKGVRLVIFGEYIYGRFGLSPDKSSVQSFLLFTNDTNLAQVTFKNDNPNKTIYVPLTDEERHIQALQDGSYLGFDWLNSAACRDQRPEDLVAPYGVESLVSPQDMERLLQTYNPQLSIAKELQSHTVQLINESLGMWIHCCNYLANEDDTHTKEDYNVKVFSNRERKNSIHHFQLAAMEKQDSTTLSRDDVYKIAPESSKLWKFTTVEELSCGVKFLLKEILELAGNTARDNYRKVVVPYDIRIAINNDKEMCDECLNCSKLFWDPPEGERQE